MNSLQPLAVLRGKRALVTGSSRGIGADTVRQLAAAGARVAINYRAKAPRAEKLANEIRGSGGEALVIGADLTNQVSVEHLFDTVREAWGGLDVLVLNASGGMEPGMPGDYAMRLNRDAQLDVLDAAVPLLAPGSRIIFVTSHQAHFIDHYPTMPEYETVARSKRAGEDALRARRQELAAADISFVVVSGDMIEGTITATLLERVNPGTIQNRRESAGKLYNVSEFASEIVQAIIQEVPENHTRYVGDVREFVQPKR